MTAIRHLQAAHPPPSNQITTVVVLPSHQESLGASPSSGAAASTRCSLACAVRAYFGMNGSLNASINRRTFVGPRPGHNESSFSVAFIIRAREPKVD
mmetsp:Transcript_23955/g.73365  ORF Transcript_23955/g.73365 Transcript_23955/m.73365 type:complete len:97 (-) Transcript_23955:921-1211(-)